MRYADLVIDHRRNRLICIREDHPKGNPTTLAAVNLDGDEFGAVLFTRQTSSPSPSEPGWP